MSGQHPTPYVKHLGLEDARDTLGLNEGQGVKTFKVTD